MDDPLTTEPITTAGLRRSDFLRRSAVAGVVATGAGASLAGPALAHGGKEHVASSPLDQKGLHNRLNHISHFDVNVSDRERSRAWYEAATTLRVVAETSADQAFPSLGIAHGRFEGYMMKDPAQAGPFPMIHLVEWKDPKPVGTPYLSQANVGWHRIVPAAADIEAARQTVIALGSEPFALRVSAGVAPWGQA